MYNVMSNKYSLTNQGSITLDKKEKGSKIETSICIIKLQIPEMSS